MVARVLICCGCCIVCAHSTHGAFPDLRGDKLLEAANIHHYLRIVTSPLLLPPPESVQCIVMSMSI